MNVQLVNTLRRQMKRLIMMFFFLSFYCWCCCCLLLLFSTHFCLRFYNSIDCDRKWGTKWLQVNLIYLYTGRLNGFIKCKSNWKWFVNHSRNSHQLPRSLITFCLLISFFFFGGMKLVLHFKVAKSIKKFGIDFKL